MSLEKNMGGSEQSPDVPIANFPADSGTYKVIQARILGKPCIRFGKPTDAYRNMVSALGTEFDREYSVLEVSIMGYTKKVALPGIKADWYHIHGMGRARVDAPKKCAYLFGGSVDYDLGIDEEHVTKVQASLPDWKLSKMEMFLLLTEEVLFDPKQKYLSLGAMTSSQPGLFIRQFTNPCQRLLEKSKKMMNIYKLEEAVSDIKMEIGYITGLFEKGKIQTVNGPVILFDNDKKKYQSTIAFYIHVLASAAKVFRSYNQPALAQACLESAADIAAPLLYDDE